MNFLKIFFFDFKTLTTNFVQFLKSFVNKKMFVYIPESESYSSSNFSVEVEWTTIVYDGNFGFTVWVGFEIDH